MSEDDDSGYYVLPPQADNIEIIRVGDMHFTMPFDDATVKLLDSVPTPIIIKMHGQVGHLVIKDAKMVDKEVMLQYHIPPAMTTPDPPGILWTRIARAVMSPTRYRSVWEPHLADMRHEHGECMKRGDFRGARMAVVRAHFYSIPSWIWGVAGSALAGVVRWLRT
jgi:hypothetical protein